MAAWDDDDQLDEALARADEDHQRVEIAPTRSQKIGRFTVVCLILNRTIGSGIFVTPARVLQGTGSVGASLILWAVGGLFATCGLLVWLELGLSVPLGDVAGEDEKKSVPRSGGEKNYIEFIFKNAPSFLVICMYGTVFVILGNLSGNAIAFGQYCYEASGLYTANTAPKGPVIGIAIAVLSVCILLHITSRRGGILLNNLFAIFKVILLCAVIVLGFIKAGGHDLGGTPKATGNFETSKSFNTNRTDVASYSDSLLYIMYTYSGFEQPFYVLSEVRRPRKTFPTYTLTAMAIATVLFILTNVAYLCAVPEDVDFANPQIDMATLFFGRVFGNVAAQQAMAALIAFSIFGNILVMTFTAARVKQEIAKEGVLPFSLFFATSTVTPWARFRRWLAKGSATVAPPDSALEHSPIAALGLHWLSSVFLIAITSMLAPSTAYSVLVSLYSYVIIVGFGFVVSGGLIYLSFARHRRWSTYCNFRLPLRPLHAFVYFIVCGFLLYAAFAKPSDVSPFAYAVSKIQWYIVPAIGQSTWFWGVLWWIGLHLHMKRKGTSLIVTRVPFNARDPDVKGQWVQKFEVVTHEWHTVQAAPVPRQMILERDQVAW